MSVRSIAALAATSFVVGVVVGFALARLLS
jgi:uncharacterized membrane-anchored protein YhcB (DUF1043 family)